MSWYQLAAIIQENEDLRRQAEIEPPLACPNCGTPLDVHRDGRRNCPMGDYTYND